MMDELKQLDKDADDLQALLEEYWFTEGDASKTTVAEHSQKYLGDEAAISKTGRAIHAMIVFDPAGANDSPMGVVSLLIGMLKRAYFRGKESMIQ